MVLHIFAHNFLNIQLIFNLIEVLESWDLELFNHTIKCYVQQSMLKVSKVIFDLWHLQHASICISFGWIWIENQLNIRKVMSINVMSPYSVFWVSFHTLNIHSITVLAVYFRFLLTPLTYPAFWSIVQRTVQYFTPLTPLTSKCLSHSFDLHCKF